MCPLFTINGLNHNMGPMVRWKKETCRVTADVCRHDVLIFCRDHCYTHLPLSVLAFQQQMHPVNMHRDKWKILNREQKGFELNIDKGGNTATTTLQHLHQLPVWRWFIDFSLHLISHALQRKLNPHNTASWSSNCFLSVFEVSRRTSLFDKCHFLLPLRECCDWKNIDI